MAEADGLGALLGDPLVSASADGPILSTDLELSFWGGVDPESGEIIDRHHPLSGQVLTGQILAIPGSRGSCTGSAVMLELLLNGKGPAGLLLARPDDILTLGVMVAEDVFDCSIPVVVLDSEAFASTKSASHARIVGGRVNLHDGNRPFGEQDDTAPPEVEVGTTEAVRLTKYDRACLGGGHGRAAQAAMRILMRMARLYGADRLIDVVQAHIDGCIYTGPGSLRFAEQMRDWGGQVAVPTTLNAISLDRRRWRDQGLSPSFAEPAGALADAYVAMGAAPTFTCAPYLLETAPRAGEQVGWGESNAVAYANSVLAARTMKVPDFLDLCIALTGRAPLAGTHRTEGRQATVRVDVARPDGADDAYYPLLGYHVGTLAAERIPVVVGLAGHAASTDDLKAFGAAFATTSGAPMFHIVGITPEAPDLAHAVGSTAGLPTVQVRIEDLQASWAELNGAGDEPVDLVSLGNPHFSLSEFEALAALCRDRRRHPGVAMVVASGEAIHRQADQRGWIAELDRFGARFVTDTCWCMIGEPIVPPAARSVMTNSAKYAHYGPGLTGKRFHFASLAGCVEAACSGHAPSGLPPWLGPNR